ncbi:MAG TPA: hypothetical protein VHO28_03370 [Ignavibacteriales bacterium]|nr:hypothetical protein [Ignavibacteriales bacterium]
MVNWKYFLSAILALIVKRLGYWLFNYNANTELQGFAADVLVYTLLYIVFVWSIGKIWKDPLAKS